MKLVFWQGIVSPHQAPYMRALARRPGWEVTVVAERPMTPDRAALGWRVPDLGAARIVFGTGVRSINALIHESGPDAIHVLQGIRGSRSALTSFGFLRRHSARIGIISESGDPEGVSGALRRMLYIYLAARYRAGLDFIFAMGDQGVRWYQGCRFPAQRIFPFAYVTDPPDGSISEATPPRPIRKFTLAFLGRLVSGKGGDLLLLALASLHDRNWRLTITGDGKDRPVWERLAAQLRLSDGVTFTGAMPNAEGRALIGSADLLVLPSRFDGWGAVVNEALMQGVPVLCSDRCGARDLLAEPWRGEVFKAGSVEGLRNVLARWIGRGKRTSELTRRIKAWSRCIEGESVASYFAEVLQHVYKGAPRPTAPWLRA